MKKTVLAILIMLFAGATFAQNQVNKMQFNAGVGFSSWGLPVYVGADFGIHKDITVGGELSFRTRSNYGSVIGISANGNYHFNTILNISSPWDFYAGLNVGYMIWKYDNSYVGAHASGLGIAGQIGGRYFFNDKLGLNIEFGGGNAFSGGKIGITYVIK